MEEGREYAERLLRLFAVGPPAAAHGGPGGDCVRPRHRARVRVSAARLLLMAPRLEDGHCGKAIREGNMGKFYRAPDHHSGPILLP